MSVSPFSLAVARVAVGFYRFWHGTLGLKGAGRMIGVLAPRIREHRPILFFEHLELSDEQVAALVPEGYSLGTVSDETGAILPCFDRSKGHNSALTPKSSVTSPQSQPDLPPN